MILYLSLQGWLSWCKKEHRTLIIFIVATLGLMTFWGVSLTSPFFLGLFKQSRFFASVLVLSETMSFICLVLLAASWWEKRNESLKLNSGVIGRTQPQCQVCTHTSLSYFPAQKTSDRRKWLSMALSSSGGLDCRSFSISSHSYPEIDVEGLAGPREEIDLNDNVNPFADPSNEGSPHNLDLSLPESDIVEESSQTIIEDAIHRSSSIIDNPFSPNSFLSRPPLARGSIQSEYISELAEYEILSREETSGNEAFECEMLTPQNDDGQETAAWTLTRHGTLESIATYSTLPSYHSRDSRTVLESESPQNPSLPSFRPLPSVILPT